MFGEKSSALMEELMKDSGELTTIDDPEQAQIPGNTSKAVNSIRREAMKRLTGQSDEIQGLDSYAYHDRGISSGLIPKNDGVAAYHPGMTLLTQTTLELLKNRDLGPISKGIIDDQIELARYLLEMTEPKILTK